MTYLRNAWTVAATSSEVGRTPFRRVLLEEPVVFYRKESGEPVALFDRCPHRLVPLSRGKLKGDDIECGYHGLRFDCSGQCTRNPHGDSIPRLAKVRSYPVIERYGFIWLWPGEASAADPALLPDFGPFEDRERFTTIGGYLRIEAGYQLIVDNLLDLSHSEFLHPMFATEDVLETTRVELVRVGNTVHSNRWKPACKVSRFLRTFWTSPSERGDARANIRWDAPGTLYLDLGVTEVGAPVEDGVFVPFAHLVSPETRSSSHYFWAMARNVRLDDKALDEQLARVATEVFATEDEPMIEAQQREIGPDADLMALKPVLLGSDGAAVAARRTLAQLIELEAASDASRPSLRASA